MPGKCRLQVRSSVLHKYIYIYINSVSTLKKDSVVTRGAIRHSQRAKHSETSSMIIFFHSNKSYRPPKNGLKNRPHLTASLFGQHLSLNTASTEWSSKSILYRLATEVYNNLVGFFTSECLRCQLALCNLFIDFP